MLTHILFTVSYKNKQPFFTLNDNSEETLTDQDTDTEEFPTHLRRGRKLTACTLTTFNEVSKATLVIFISFSIGFSTDGH